MLTAIQLLTNQKDNGSITQTVFSRTGSTCISSCTIKMVASSFARNNITSIVADILKTHYYITSQDAKPDCQFSLRRSMCW